MWLNHRIKIISNYSKTLVSFKNIIIKGFRLRMGNPDTYVSRIGRLRSPNRLKKWKIIEKISKFSKNLGSVSDLLPIPALTCKILFSSNIKKFSRLHINSIFKPIRQIDKFFKWEIYHFIKIITYQTSVSV